MSSVEYGSLTLDILVGVGVLLIGIGVLIGMLALARTLARVGDTLGRIDRQVELLGPPAAATIAHVEGMTQSLEAAAGNVSQTVGLTKSALVPTIVNVGAALSGVSAGLRRLVTGKDSKNQGVG